MLEAEKQVLKLKYMYKFSWSLRGYYYQFPYTLKYSLFQILVMLYDANKYFLTTHKIPDSPYF